MYNTFRKIFDLYGTGVGSFFFIKKFVELAASLTSEDRKLFPTMVHQLSRLVNKRLVVMVRTLKTVIALLF